MPDGKTTTYPLDFGTPRSVPLVNTRVGESANEAAARCGWRLLNRRETNALYASDDNATVVGAIGNGETVYLAVAVKEASNDPEGAEIAHMEMRGRA